MNWYWSVFKSSSQSSAGSRWRLQTVLRGRRSSVSLTHDEWSAFYDGWGQPAGIISHFNTLKRNKTTPSGQIVPTQFSFWTIWIHILYLTLWYFKAHPCTHHLRLVIVLNRQLTMRRMVKNWFKHLSEGIFLYPNEDKRCDLVERQSEVLWFNDMIIGAAPLPPSSGAWLCPSSLNNSEFQC